MRQKINKVFLTFLAAATVFSSTPTKGEKITVNMPTTIYSGKEENIISSGVTHEKISRFTTSGWHNINVIRVNLTDPYTDIKGLFNAEGIPKKDKVSSMVEKSGAIAGINGDFFNTQPVSSAMGTLINNGEIISSPIEKAYALPTFYLTSSNVAKIEYMDRSMKAENATSGQKIIINTINKVTKDFDTVTLLNKHWGKQSIGKKYHRDLIEVIVSNNVVTDVRVGMNAVDIPRDGYVLAVRGERTQGLEKFKVGDSVNLNISTTPDINQIKFAIGGGSIILKDGELSRTNINIKGANPRSGIGISKDGKEMILVTIDGRDSSFIGVSQEMFGYILRDLGAYNALNLDGGGSTAMAIKPIDEKKATVVNKPSEGTERYVVNSVGVFSTAPVGELASIKISTDDIKMFLNTSRKFTVKGYDEHQNPVSIEEANVVFSVEEVKGTIEKNIFKALSSGKATITAKYNDISATIDLNVLGAVEDLTTKTSSFSLNTNSTRNLPKFYGKDANGYESEIYPRDIEFKALNDIGTVALDVFYSGEKSTAGILSGKIGNGVENIKVYVGSKGEVIYGFDSMEGLTVSTHPSTVTGSISLSDDKKEGKSSVSLKYDFSKASDTRAAYLNFGGEKKVGLSVKGSPSKLGLWVNGDSSGSWLRGSIKDKNGKSQYIDFSKSIDFTGWQFVEANIPSNVTYPIVLERIYPVETNNLKKQSGELLFDGLTGYYPPTLGTVEAPTVSSLKDNKNNKQELKKDGFTFSVVVDPIGLNKAVGYDAEAKIADRINKGKISVMLNGMSNGFRSRLKNYAVINASGAYSTNKHQDVYFVHVNTSKGGIRQSNANQWKSLIDVLENRGETNIMLFLSSPLFGSNGFSDNLEAELLNDYLVKAHESGKNIFVVQGSNKNSSDLKDGIRYIEMNTSKIKKSGDIYNLSILEFVVNNDDVSYQLSPLFKK